MWPFCFSPSSRHQSLFLRAYSSLLATQTWWEVQQILQNKCPELLTNKKIVFSMLSVNTEKRNSRVRLSLTKRACWHKRRNRNNTSLLNPHTHQSRSPSNASIMLIGYLIWKALLNFMDQVHEQWEWKGSSWLIVHTIVLLWSMNVHGCDVLL